MGNIQKKLSQEKEVTPEIKVLTEDQIKIIKRTYEIPSAHLFDFGENVFSKYLERYPHNQQSFQAFRNTPLLLLKGTPGFRAHASRIMNVFSCVIDSLDKDRNLTEIKKIVADVGKFHAQRKVSKKAFNELREVLTEILIAECNLDDEGIEAWSNLLDTFYHVIFECFDGKSDQFYST